MRFQAKISDRDGVTLPNGEAVKSPREAPPKRKVQRHSPDRLLRQKLVLPGEITVSAEKHRGRLVVRVESPDDEQ
jgi:hypothetical protein